MEPNDAIIAINDCMEAVLSFQKFCSNNSATACLKYLCDIFAKTCNLSKSVTNAILQFDNNKKQDNKQHNNKYNLLHHILNGKETFYHLTGSNLHQYHSNSLSPSFPDTKSLHDLLAVKLQSHITGNTIAIVYAAKQRSIKDNWNDDEDGDDEDAKDEKKETKDNDKSNSSSSNNNDEKNSKHIFLTYEIQLFLQLLNIADSKIRNESNRLELEDIENNINTIRKKNKTLENSLIEITNENQSIIDKLKSNKDLTFKLQNDIKRLNVYVLDAKKWKNQELIRNGLLTLNSDDDSKSIVITKLKTSLGSILEVPPNACSISIEYFQGLEEDESNHSNNLFSNMSKLIKQPNHVYDSIQFVLEHKNITLGHIATPSISNKNENNGSKDNSFENDKRLLLQEWIRCANIFLYIWRRKRILKWKENNILKSKERIHLIMTSMEKMKNEKDSIIKDKNQLNIKLIKLLQLYDKEKEMRLQIEGKINLLIDENEKLKQKYFLSDHHDDPLTRMIELSSTEHVESVRRVNLQRRCIELEMKVKKQQQELAKQQLLHEAAEKNALIKITELNVELKRSKVYCDEMRTKYEIMSSRYQFHIARSKNILLPEK